ncbi:MAG: DUF2207 domain-containing protein [Candidatus Micrarchaeota archaeon]
MMRYWLFILILAVFTSTIFPFSINSYYTHTTVLQNGDVQIYENINFTLEKVYNEGYRDIRKEDYEILDNVIVQSVKVNGHDVNYKKQNYGDKAEIVWTQTYKGQNNVELNYILKNRAQLYDDFAKICIEHYGAGWSVYGTKFHSEMTLPEASRGKEMHFEIYSTKKGNAYIDDLTVVVNIENVPPGNYVGGCYLYDKSALQTNNKVNGSAYDILTDERKIYGSEIIIEPEKNLDLPPLSLICLPISLLIGGIAIYTYNNEKKKPKYPENILPPNNEEPAVVSALIRNSVPRQDIMAATILDLINKNVLDIIELENKGEISSKVKREKTILILKKRPRNISEKENIILDMLFSGGSTQVNLDQMAKDFDAIKTKHDAERNPIGSGIVKFDNVITKILKEKKVESHNSKVTLVWLLICAGILLGPVTICPLSTIILAWFGGLVISGNYVEIIGLVVAGMITFTSGIYLTILGLQPVVPKGMEDEYSRWDGFVRAVKSSRLKEYPPESTLIWGEVLVYATAIGLADKVKKHLSELNKLTLEKIEEMDEIRLSSIRFYTSALALNNLRKYGSRRGRKGRGHGGFSSHSSGGWSSHGGGGFSGRSSGGGGFR